MMMKRLVPLSWMILMLAAGCGGRTPLKIGPALDGGLPDADADVDAGGLSVDCGRSDQYTTTGLAITLRGMADSPDGIDSMAWALLSTPPVSMVAIAPTVGPTTTLTPDQLGDYRVRFTARDGGGRSASCEVAVHAVVGPPVALCPEDELVTGVGVPLVVVGDGFDDNAVVGYRWAVSTTPPGNTARIMPMDAAVTNFTADGPGIYELTLTVTDNEGAVDSCVTRIRVTRPPVVTCPDSPIRAPTRQPVTVRAEATDDTEVVRVRWQMTSKPGMSTAALDPLNRRETSFTPDRQGNYNLEFTATDSDGLTASCTVQVIGTPTHPDAICTDVETSPLSAVAVPGDAVDDGTIVGWRWQLIGQPAGSAPMPPSPGNAQNTNFTPDIAGDYSLQLTVTDNDGMTGSCVANVAAISTQGLRVEMFWDTNDSDMDTHLLHPDGTRWFTAPWDCYFSDCVGGGPDWYNPGPDDDASLDIDNTTGLGPENINIQTPHDGVYRIGIHAWRGFANRLTVNIYCGGATTTPTQSFGPISMRNGTSREFWRVADVTIRGPRCTITDLSTGGRPNLSDRASADRMR